jgi:hypothetical protein
MTNSEVKHVLEAPSTISRQLILSLALLAALLCSSMAEGRDEADSVIAGSPSTVKFIRDPELPNCSSALVRGDPAKGPFTWLDKSDGDCFVPMHWHNQGEIIIVVSGTAEIEVKNHPLVILRDGGYYYQPPHQIASGRFAKGTIGFTSFDGPFDMHYVDDTGKEISREQAFSRVTKPKRPTVEKPRAP